MRPPDSWKSARLTLAIAVVTVAAWAIPTFLGYETLVALWGGFIPARIGGAVPPFPTAPLFLTPLTATLVHAGFIHIFFNMLMLLFCGRPVEAIVGRRGFAILYLVGAYAAAAVHTLAGPHQLQPMVGASGAISAVLGAYALLFGRNKVRVGNAAAATFLHALWLFAAWTVLNLLVGLTIEVDGARIAVAAHIGGFLAGLALARPLLLLKWRGA
ncbi:MAG: rhomboid family intramembrane serine protease [Alphaproteobacteria bacterium]|nr:rhomboid family intramembrane serine protease [Alphaproteobacteria bacterium]